VGRRVLGWVAPAVTFLALLALWWLATIVFDWPPWLVPTPWDVAQSLWEHRDLLPHQTWVTLWESLAGFGLAIVVGIPVGGLIAYSRFLERTIYPILLGLNAVPKIAIAPILILWMGFGYGPKILVSFLLCVFPIVIATATGLKQTPAELVELARSLSASPWQAFAKFRFPWALPEIFIGLKVAISLAVIGAVIGEFIGSNEGLGNLLLTANSQLNSALVWASLVVLSVLGMLLYGAVVLAEKIMMPWAPDSGHK
jgi:NitT/TauT family transport system permease protein